MRLKKYRFLSGGGGGLKRVVSFNFDKLVLVHIDVEAQSVE